MNFRSIILVLLVFFTSFSAYPFWIWSPKNQKWKNPKTSPLSTPKMQYNEAKRVFDAGNYAIAYKEFKKVTVNYPDSQQAAKAQYYLGRCLEMTDNPLQAFKEYSVVINSYPNSEDINEIIKRQYDIGEYFLNQKSAKWLGISKHDFIEHPAIEIFSFIVNYASQSEYAPRAQYKLGLLFMGLGRYDEAKKEFQRVIDNYPETQWSDSAKYQYAIAAARSSGGIDYDSTDMKEAERRFNQFIKENPDTVIADAAQEELDDVRAQEALKNLNIAEFYEKQNKIESARIYYKKVITDFYDSDYYDAAVAGIDRLNNIEYEGMDAKEISLAKKEEKRLKKKRLKESKKAEVLKRRETKKSDREEKRKQKRLAKDAAILEKKELRAAKRAKKQTKGVKSENKTEDEKDIIKKESQNVKVKTKIERKTEKAKPKEAKRT
ncbi:MAG: tetratricopeptide repeat protein, partial [Candidatus Omnitrophica bacterium]|nr:tetratricopeptide repeat protein [Candidatus Omnitrophota bacterium]